MYMKSSIFIDPNIFLCYTKEIQWESSKNIICISNHENFKEKKPPEFDPRDSNCFKHVMDENFNVEKIQILASSRNPN